MVRQACAIGPCLEKTYRKTKGTSFFYLRNVKDPFVKRAWHDKILSTRKDVVSRDQLHHVAICSRHFVNGNSNNLPTIIPRKVGNTIIWPEVTKCRPKQTRRELFCQVGGTSSIDVSQRDTKNEFDVLSPNQGLKRKLNQLHNQLTESPPKEIKEIDMRKNDEINGMSRAVKKIFDEVMVSPKKKKSPPLSEKLQNLQQKSENEPIGVADSNVKTPVAKESLIIQLKNMLDQERKRNAELEYQLEYTQKMKCFGIDRFSGSPCDINFYTGIPDYLSFLAICDFLQPEKHRMQSLYYERKDTDNTYVLSKGREPRLSLQEQLFLVLCRLRQGFREIDLANRFEISVGTVSDIISKWIKHMAHVLGQLPIWPSKELIQERMPQSFKDLDYGSTRCIVDCTEIFLQQPSSNLVLQTILFSSYKNHHTAKGLIGIAPHGPVIFVSDLYVGSASDTDITKDCGLLNLIEPGDHIMADKGFEIQSLLDPLSVRVDHPPILRGVTQMTVEQETSTRRIARLRIHVERAIERVKNFRILQENFSYKQWRMLNDVWKICAILTHFQPKLIDD